MVCTFQAGISLAFQQSFEEQEAVQETHPLAKYIQKQCQQSPAIDPVWNVKMLRFLMVEIAIWQVLGSKLPLLLKCRWRNGWRNCGRRCKFTRAPPLQLSCWKSYGKLCCACFRHISLHCFRKCRMVPVREEWRQGNWHARNRWWVLSRREAKDFHDTCVFWNSFSHMFLEWMEKNFKQSV